MTMLRRIISAGLLLLLAAAPAMAAVSAAPDEAIFFADPNYRGKSLSVRLEPGVRHKLLPHLGGLAKDISSMIIGKNVKVMVFTSPDFGGAVREYRQSIAEGMPDDDQISSLLVCPEESVPQGVLLIQKRIGEVKKTSRRAWSYITGEGRFFPLPEAATESESRFPQLTADWCDQVRFVYVAPGVETELFADPEFGGRSLTLPGPEADHRSFFDLTSLGFYDPKKKPPGVISSLLVRARSSQRP